jgi:hypothetical protein
VTSCGYKGKRKKAMESSGEPRWGAREQSPVTSHQAVNDSPPALPDPGHANVTERQARACDHATLVAMWMSPVYMTVCGPRSCTQESVLLGVTTRLQQTLRRRQSGPIPMSNEPTPVPMPIPMPVPVPIQCQSHRQCQNQCQYQSHTQSPLPFVFCRTCPSLSHSSYPPRCCSTPLELRPRRSHHRFVSSLTRGTSASLVVSDEENPVPDPPDPLDLLEVDGGWKSGPSCSSDP